MDPSSTTQQMSYDCPRPVISSAAVAGAGEPALSFDVADSSRWPASELRAEGTWYYLETPRRRR